MISFSIIILNWNGLHHLREFLPSVVNTDYPEFEILLADNHSDDESVRLVRDKYPKIRIIELEHNFGYCGGNNRVARYAKGEILIFLNNDVRVDPKWLHPLNRLFCRYPDMAAAQPKVLSVRKPDTFEYAGAAGGQLDKLGYPWCRGRLFDQTELDTGQYDDYPARIFWASGAALCIRKTDFEQSGGFDESFEFHMEEIDLCWRLQRAGRGIRYCPQSVVWHLGGGSLKTDSPRKVYFNFRNNLIMLTKNYPSGGLVPVLFIRLFLDLAAAGQFLVKGQPAACRAVLKALKTFYLAFPHWMEKRGKEMQKFPLTRRLHGFGPASIVWKYFVKRRKSGDF